MQGPDLGHSQMVLLGVGIVRYENATCLSLWVGSETFPRLLLPNEARHNFRFLSPLLSKDS